MKHYRIAACLAILMLSQPASALGLAEIWYPVTLPYNQVDEEEIEVRKLPFATRFSHPEFIGDALSAPYPVPNNDSTPLPKDINVISANGIQISTNPISSNVADSGREGKRVRVELVVDLRKYARPSYPSPPDSAVMTAVAEAVLRSLTSYDCEVADTKIHATEEQVELKKALVLALQTEIAEQAGAGQPGTGSAATRPESKSEDSQKPQPESEGRSR